MRPSSPRSGAYDRLEGGFGPARAARQFGWKRIAAAAAVLVTLVYLLAPSGAGSAAAGVAHPDLSLVDTDPLPPPVERPAKGKGPAPVTPAVSAPSSPETDPDMLGTVHCKAAHAGAKRLVQYALMIDAGSTGSRVHIYKFHNCGAAPAYEYEVFKMTQPGLSSYKGNPEAAAQSLDVLLERAREVVPASLHACTPVQVKATAGLRLLGQDQSAAILAAVRKRLEHAFPFPLYTAPGGDAVAIMDGTDEAVFAWITANYLLHAIGADAGTAGRTPAGSYAVLDLGGASTQIVFEPAFANPGGFADGEHKYTLQFGGRTHTLYQHSYLGYGLMRARKHVHQLVDFMSSIRSHPGAAVANPCLAQGTQQLVEVEDTRDADRNRNITMSGEDVGSFESCNRIVELVMAKDAVCQVKPCAFDGVYQPSLMDTFPSGKVLLLSYFYDRLEPLIGDAPLTVATIAATARDVCAGASEWQRRWGAKPEVMKELKGRPEWCLDLTFMHALLRLGYEFGAERPVGIGKKIEGTELGWCLGATLAMVGGELTCRA